jgi:hypothetical protein
LGAFLLNVAAALFFVGVLVHAHTLLPAVARARVTELDRAGAFCVQKLSEYDAALADVRTNVGPFIAAGYHDAIILVSCVGICLGTVNAVLLFVWRRRLLRAG